MVNLMSVVLREKKAAHASVPRRIQPVPYSLALHALAAAAAFTAARAPLFGSLYPLGMGLLLAVPNRFFISAALGAGAGCFLLGLPGSAAYLCCIACAAAFRLTLQLLHRTSRPFVAQGAVCIVFGVLRTVLLLPEKTLSSALSAAAAESALIFGICCLLSGFFALPFPICGASREERISLCAAFGCAVAALAPYTVFSLSPARILAAVCILLAARCSPVPADAVIAAVCSAAALCAADPFHLHAGFALACGAVAAVFFRRTNRFAFAFAFFVAGLFGVSCAPDVDAGIVLCVELFLSCIASLFLPWIRTGSVRLPGPQNGTALRAQRTALSAQLETVSEAFCFVGSTMRTVCDRLPLHRESAAELADTVAERCCKNCGKRIYCWVDCADETYEAFAKLSAQAVYPDGLPATELPTILQRRCQMPIRLTNAVNSVFAERAARRVMHAESRRTRSALCDQYRAFSLLLADLSRQVYCTDLPDRRKAQKLEQRFAALGLDVLESSAAVDAAGALSVRVSLPDAPLSEAELKHLTNEVSGIFRRSFFAVQCTHSGVAVQLRFTERPPFCAEYALCSLPADGAVCADVAECFHDPLGKFHTVLCDGMGTGKAAAVGGTLCARLMRELLHAGFCAQSAAKLVNIALTLKSDDENAVALDALSINLYTGSAELYKAGGAASFLLHDGHIAVYDADTLPIGILGTVTDHREPLQLCLGDTLVLVSDGALCTGREVLCGAMLRAQDEPLEAFCRSCAQCARECSPEKSDDITVLAVRLCAAPAP